MLGLLGALDPYRKRTLHQESNEECLVIPDPDTTDTLGGLLRTALSLLVRQANYGRGGLKLLACLRISSCNSTIVWRSLSCVETSISAVWHFVNTYFV